MRRHAGGAGILFPAERALYSLAARLGPPVLGVFLLAGASPALAALPQGFQESVVFSGLTQPTAFRFASDGRVFVAEKNGLIKVFDGLTDTTPTVFADLRTNVHNYWDRGLLGLALHPDFPATPYVYVLYTYDAAPGGTARAGERREPPATDVRTRRAARPTAAS